MPSHVPATSTRTILQREVLWVPPRCLGAVLWGSVGQDLRQSDGWWRVWSCSSPRHGWFAVVGVPVRQQSLEASPCAAEKCSASPVPCYRGHRLRHAAALPAGHLWRGHHRALAKGEAASAASKRSRMPLLATFFLALPRGVNFQAPRAARRHVYRLEKHRQICDRRGAAMERPKGLGKRQSSARPVPGMLPLPPALRGHHGHGPALKPEQKR